MRMTGILLLPAGWLIALAAVVLLPAAAPRGGFAFAGLAVQVLGLGLVFRSHLSARGER